MEIIQAGVQILFAIFGFGLGVYVAITISDDDDHCEHCQFALNNTCNILIWRLW